MASHLVSKARLLSYTALLGGVVFSLPTQAVTSETLPYAADSHAGSIAADTDANPYIRRRAIIKLQELKETASTQDEPAPVTIVPPQPEPHQPLKITIPNLQAVQQTPHPVTTVAITGPATAPTAPNAPVPAPTVAATSPPPVPATRTTLQSDATPAAAMPQSAAAAANMADSTEATGLFEQLFASLFPESDRDDAQESHERKPLSMPPSFILAHAPEGTTMQVSDDGKTTTLYSPGVVIHKEQQAPQVAIVQPDNPPTANQLAMLAPAAGPSDAVPVPLIQLPDNPPASVPSTAHAATPPAAAKSLEAIVQSDVTPLPAGPKPTAAKTPVITAIAPTGAYANSSHAATQDNLLSLLTHETSTPDALPSIEPLVTPPPKETKHANHDIPPPAKDISEPEGNLSSQSKKILHHIPSHIDEHTHSASSLAINRAREAKDVFNPEDTNVQTVKHEAMGIKIEVKKPAFDMNYELEKAYDALIGGHTDTAINIYKNVLANDPNSTNALFDLATLYHRAGQIELARPLYARLLAINPQHRDGLNNFLTLLTDEAPQEALAQLQDLEKRNPDFAPIPAQLAVIYEKIGYMDKANAQMIHAVELAPENLTYRYNMAIMLDKQGKYEEAAKLYQQIIEAANRGDPVPGNLQKIQQRLTFISSNRP